MELFLLREEGLCKGSFILTYLIYQNLECLLCVRPYIWLWEDMDTFWTILPLRQLLLFGNELVNESYLFHQAYQLVGY